MYTAYVMKIYIRETQFIHAASEMKAFVFPFT